MKKPLPAVSVKLDAKLVAKFEKLLREGLVASGAVSDADNKNSGMRVRAKATVKVSPAVVARFTELLRDGLVASGALSDADNKNSDMMTKRVR